MDDPKIRRAVICECIDRDIVLTHFDDDSLTIIVKEVAEEHPEVLMEERASPRHVDTIKMVLDKIFKCKCRIE